MSPQGYVRRRRIERAGQLMLSTDATLCQIAIECGFSDQSHLTRRFVAALGERPRDWRKAAWSAQPHLLAQAADQRIECHFAAGTAP